MIKIQESNKKLLNKQMKQLQAAIKTNKKIIKYDDRPHQRDLARSRLNILKPKYEKLQQELQRVGA